MMLNDVLYHVTVRSMILHNVRGGNSYEKHDFQIDSGLTIFIVDLNNQLI